METWKLNGLILKFVNGHDILTAILKSGLTEDQDRRINAITAFIKEQHDNKDQVKFKQVELQSNIFDLFVGVPM